MHLLRAIARSPSLLRVPITVCFSPLASPIHSALPEKSPSPSQEESDESISSCSSTLPSFKDLVFLEKSPYPCREQREDPLPTSPSTLPSPQDRVFLEKQPSLSQSEEPPCAIPEIALMDKDGAFSEGEGCPNEPPEPLSFRVERLPLGVPVATAFQSWMGEGFCVHRGYIFHAINRLRRLNKTKRALEVMEWVIRERPYKLKELDYSYLVEFTTKLHGVSAGEGLFTRIPEEYKHELLYNNLIMACLDKGAVKLSLVYMMKMRELSFPISPFVYNRLILLHSSLDKRRKIPKILAQMKADRVSPHVSTYNILLKMEADDHNIEGIEKVLTDIKRSKVKLNEISYGILAAAYAVARLPTACAIYVESLEASRTGKNWSTLDMLLMLYGYLGNVDKLSKTWNRVKELPHVRSKSNLLAIEAFGRVGRIDKCEELWAELKSKGDLKLTKEFNSIISAYCRHGHLLQASNFFKEMRKAECVPNAITYRHLSLGCLKAGLVKEALRTLEMGKNQPANYQIRRSTPWLEATFAMLEIFADMGDVDNAKKLFMELKECRYTRYTFVWNSYLRSHVKAKAYESNLLKYMVLGGARPDTETHTLLRLIEQFKS